MDNTKEKDWPVAPEAKHINDQVLIEFIKMATDDPTIIVPVTILVSGLIISGLVGDPIKFSTENVNQEDPVELTPERIEERKQNRIQMQSDLQNRPLDKFSFLHLYDAKIINPNGKAIPSNRAVSIRLKLESIDGWFYGLLGDHD